MRSRTVEVEDGAEKAGVGANMLLDARALERETSELDAIASEAVADMVAESSLELVGASSGHAPPVNRPNSMT
jgi:hypothetical protein